MGNLVSYDIIKITMMQIKSNSSKIFVWQEKQQILPLYQVSLFRSFESMVEVLLVLEIQKFFIVYYGKIYCWGKLILAFLQHGYYHMGLNKFSNVQVAIVFGVIQRIIITYLQGIKMRHP